MADIDECVPNFATPKPLPHPQQTACIFSNLDLTPEKKQNRSGISKPCGNNDHLLSIPAINSTARTQLKIGELISKKGKAIKSLPVDSLCQSSGVLKAVNVPFNTRQYSDLTSVELPKVMDVCPTQTAHLPPSCRTAKATEEPDILDFFDPSHISETAIWDTDHLLHDLQLVGPPVGSVYTLYHHMRECSDNKLLLIK